MNKTLGPEVEHWGPSHDTYLQTMLTYAEIVKSTEAEDRTGRLGRVRLAFSVKMSEAMKLQDKIGAARFRTDAVFRRFNLEDRKLNPVTRQDAKRVLRFRDHETRLLTR